MQLILYPVMEKKNPNGLTLKQDWWPVIKWIWSLGVFLLLIGTEWKMMHLAGAGVSFTLGLLLNLFCTLFALFKIVDRNWINYVIGGSFIVTIIGHTLVNITAFCQTFYRG